MKIKVIFNNISAMRVGLRSVSKQTFICPESYFCYENQYGSFFYLKNNDVITVPDDEYEMFFSAGCKFVPIKKLISQPESDATTLHVKIEALEYAPANNWRDADLHVHSPYRDEAVIPKITHDNLPIEIIAENINFTCIVDGSYPAFSVNKDQILIQADEYRNGTYGHYLFFRGFEEIEHTRDQYPPENPYPLPMKLFSEAKHSGAVVVCAHPITHCKLEDESPWPGSGYARGILEFLGAGFIDAITIADLSSDREAAQELWYKLLNCGIKVPAIACCDICLRQSVFPPVGTWRTLVKASAARSFEDFLAEVRKGRTLLSTAPILNVKLDEYVPGDTVQTSSKKRLLDIELSSPGKINTLRIIIDGEIYQEIEVNDNNFKYQKTIDIEPGRWLAVECVGAANWYYSQGLWAHTNPIYFSSKVDKQIFSDSHAYLENILVELKKYFAKRNYPDTTPCGTRFVASLAEAYNSQNQ